MKSVLALLLGLVLLPSTVRAMDTPRVRDDGHFFSAEAIARADERILQIKQTFGKDLYIETAPEIPAQMRASFNPEKRGKFFRDWARLREKELDVNGIVVLICRDPSYLQVSVDAGTLKQAFVQQNVDALKASMLSDFKAKEFDRALVSAADYVDATFQTSLPKRAAPATERAEVVASPVSDRAAPVAPSGERGSSDVQDVAADPVSATGNRPGIGTWICLGVGVIVLLMIVRGLMSARRTQTAPGPGFGPGGASLGAGYGGVQSPGGGAGQGFMAGILGGMIGGAVSDRMRDRETPNQDSGSAGGEFDATDDESGTAGGSFDTPADSGDAGGGDAGGGDGGSAGGDF